MVAIIAVIAFALGFIAGGYLTMRWRGEIFTGAMEKILDEQGYEIDDGRILPKGDTEVKQMARAVMVGTDSYYPNSVIGVMYDDLQMTIGDDD